MNLRPRYPLLFLGILLMLGSGALAWAGGQRKADGDITARSAPVLVAAIDVDDEPAGDADGLQSAGGQSAEPVEEIRAVTFSTPSCRHRENAERDRRPETLVGTVVLLI